MAALAGPQVEYVLCRTTPSPGWVRGRSKASGESTGFANGTSTSNSRTAGATSFPGCGGSQPRVREARNEAEAAGRQLGRRQRPEGVEPRCAVEEVGVVDDEQQSRIAMAAPKASATNLALTATTRFPTTRPSQNSRNEPATVGMTIGFACTAAGIVPGRRQMFRDGQFDRDRLRSGRAGPMGVETNTHMRLHSAARQLPLEPADPQTGPSLRRLLAADAIVTHFQPIFSVRQRSIVDGSALPRAMVERPADRAI